MSKLRVLDLFSGIGGFSLGLERTGGFETVAFCEIEPYPRAVLKKHWPDVPCYDDVRTLTAETLSRDGISVDVICGGFPCQDISAAGNQGGLDGTRSGLWSEIARLMGELRPRFVIVENVSALLSGPSEQPGGWFGRVLGDVAALGYDAEWNCIPASAVGAPHRRDRVWLVAYPGNLRRHAGRAEQSLQGAWLGGEAFAAQPMADAKSHGRKPRGAGDAAQEPVWGQLDRSGIRFDVPDAAGERCPQEGKFRRNEPAERIAGACEVMADAEHSGLKGRDQNRPWPGTTLSHCGWSVEPDVGRVAYGVPQRVDRLKGLGNAVVPQIPELIGRAILEAEGLTP